MDLLRSLRAAHDDPKRHDEILRAVITEGARGEAVMVDALERASRGLRSSLVVALGEARGPLGGDVLRPIPTDRAEATDTSCAALIALAKRVGADASDVYAAGLRDSRPDVRVYASICLAAAGDDRAWADVLARLRRLLRRPVPAFPPGMDRRLLSMQSQVLYAIAYLGRHLDPPDRATTVADLVRRRWERLYLAEQEWLLDHWPACSPSSSPAAAALRPNPELLVAWIRRPLLEPLYN